MMAERPGGAMKVRIYNEDFVGAILSEHALDDAIEWIQANLEPEDVFSLDELAKWAKVWAENDGYIKG
jgi:hypothetical protein